MFRHRSLSRRMWGALHVIGAIVVSLTADCSTNWARKSPAICAHAFVPPPPLDSYRRLDRHHQFDGSSPLSFGNSIILSAKVGRPKRSEEEREALYKERKEQIKEALCLDQKQIDKLVSTNPGALEYRVEENVMPKVEMLQERLGVDQKTAGKILSLPFVFGISVSSSLQNIDWLQDRLYLDAKGIAKLISTNPTLLSIKKETLEKKIQFIRNCLDMTDDEVTELITKYSAILHLSVEEKIPARMSYLQTRFELDDKSLKEILKKNPRLLNMSIETSIEPKLAFYSALIGEKKAKRLVMESTNLLVESLEKKLKPRLAEVQKLGMKVNWDETLIQRLARRPKERWERYKLEDVMTVRQREREQNNT